MKKLAIVGVVPLLAVAGYAAYSRMHAKAPAPPKPSPGLLRMSAPSRLEEVRIRQEIKKTQVSSVPASLTWDVEVPEAAKLQFAIGVHPEDERPQPPAEKTIRLWVEGDCKSLFDTKLAAGASWKEVEVDLAAYAGRKAKIVFRAEPLVESASALRVMWGNPEIHSTKYTSNRPNFLIISVDTLRADHLHCYGYGRDTSPTIDRFAAQGLRFANAYTSESSTWPALTSMMTSLQPSTHGVTENGYRLAEGIISLAEILSSQGYTTSAVLANMGTAVHRGYDQRYNYKDQQAVGKYLQRLRADQHKPFFHWVHFIGPHDSYAPPKPFDTFFGPVSNPRVGLHRTLADITWSRKPPAPQQMNDIISLYDGEIRAVDSYVKRILNELRRTKLDSNTLVIFTADHGEELFDHNNFSFHSGTVYNPTLHIPLILRLPASMPRRGAEETPVSIVDIAPTILEIAGLKAPASFQGQSLLVRSSARRGQALSETWEIFTLVDSTYRYVYNPKNIHPKTEAKGWPYAIKAEELYDVRSDRLQKTDILQSNQQTAAALKAHLIEWMGKVVKGPAKKQEIDKETQEELKALGYIYEK
ncbi:MAG: sulfatase [Acidobacteriota bacterium]